MSKFCGNCGAVMDDAAAVCGNCGAQLAAAPAPVQVATEAPAAAKKVDVDAVVGKAKAAATDIIGGVKNGDKGSMIKGGIAVAAVAVVLILIISLFSGGGEEKVVKKFIKAYDKENAAALVKLAPKYVRELAEERDLDLEESYEDAIADFYEYMEEELDADKLSFKYKIADIDEVDEDDLEYYADSIKSAIKMIDADVDFKKAKVTKGCEVEVDVTVKGGGDKDKVDLYLTLIKYSGKWYVVEYDWDY